MDNRDVFKAFIANSHIDWERFKNLLAYWEGHFDQLSVEQAEVLDYLRAYTSIKSKTTNRVPKEFLEMYIMAFVDETEMREVS